MDKSLRYKFFFPFLAHLPFSIGYSAAATYWKLNAVQRQEALLALGSSIPKSLPFLSANEADFDGLIDEYLEMMAHEIMDIFYLDASVGRNSLALVTLEGLEHLSDARNQGRGVILVMGHYGRPNMLSSRVGLAGEPHGFVTQNINDNNPDRCPHDLAYLQFKVATTLRFAKGPWISKGDNTKDIFKAIAENRILIILLDVFEPNKQKSKQYDFLGGRLQIPTGIERIAQKTGARMVYGVAHCEGKRVRAQLRPLPEDPCEGIRGAVAELERDVIKSPGQWWQWNTLGHIWQPAPKVFAIQKP